MGFILSRFLTVDAGRIASTARHVIGPSVTVSAAYHHSFVLRVRRVKCFIGLESVPPDPAQGHIQPGFKRVALAAQQASISA